MTIAWNEFTPWASLAGGVLIGLAAALLVLFNGRIAGISGILGGLLRPRGFCARGERLAQLLQVGQSGLTAPHSPATAGRRARPCSRCRRW